MSGLGYELEAVGAQICMAEHVDVGFMEDFAHDLPPVEVQEFMQRLAAQVPDTLSQARDARASDGFAAGNPGQ